MLPAERRLKIMQDINVGGLVSADTLAERFDVSLETIRRDLRDLERQGLLQRVYGGAVGPEVRSDQQSFELRRLQNLERKRAIAERAAGALEHGETIFVDAGSTCLELARAIPQGWTGRVLTSSMHVAMEMTARGGVEVVLTGGSVRAGDLSLSGPFAVPLSDMFYVARAFVGAGGVHPDAGLTDYEVQEGIARRRWIDKAAAFVVLADSSKLGVIAPFVVAPLARVSVVVTDGEDRVDVIEDLRANGTEVIACGGPLRSPPSEREATLGDAYVP